MDARRFTFEGQEFSFAEFIEGQEELAAEVAALQVGEEVRFPIGGGWSEPVRRVA